MTVAEQLAVFVLRFSYTDLSRAAQQQLKIRVLDALGCAIGALEGEPIRLLRKVSVRPSDAYSQQFPDQMPCRLTVSLSDGRTLVKEKQDYEGFHTRPMEWGAVVQKFERLSAPYTDAPLRRAIVDAVANLESLRVSDLMRLLGQARQGG